MIGIALKFNLPEQQFTGLVNSDSRAARLTLLDDAVQNHLAEIASTLASRQNSFTGARRFLVPQTILAACMSGYRGPAVNFADFGTGLGILPRQLNSVSMYERFAGDLRWPSGIPAFCPLPVGRKFGVDRAEFPSLKWVRACYGSSAYYRDLYGEVLDVLAVLSDDPADTCLVAVDLLDSDALRRFVQDNRIGMANFCYSLYEFSWEKRTQVIATVLDSLAPPGLALVIEPRAELTQQGCEVVLHSRDHGRPLSLCTVSDGHFKGVVRAGDDYEYFTDRYPIEFSRESVRNEP
ncbi:hypothetical protein D5S17_20410 [Pseudonocardiaceae bacterium YIM PH 21723]|nr:hypothetical protein D5S17_20410 [Pseudonocardiaceae bacterium YIM PH 21723]